MCVCVYVQGIELKSRVSTFTYHAQLAQPSPRAAIFERPRSVVDPVRAKSASGHIPSDLPAAAQLLSTGVTNAYG